MTWMLTASGITVDLRVMAPDTISVLDIAHHLSQINRYTGACIRPYSVAEHSLLVHDIVQRESDERDPRVLLCALMHDAHEAYTNDLSTPMKETVGEAWAAEEARIQRQVLQRFGLAEAMDKWHPLIKWADLTALSTERRALLSAEGPEWPATRTHKPVHWAMLGGRAPTDWRAWKNLFLARFVELDCDRRHIAMGTQAAA